MEALICCVICGNPNLSSKCPQDNDLSVEMVAKFLKQLGVRSSPEVRLCEECYSQVGKAVGWRQEVREVERDVRSLQRIILKMSRPLEPLRHNYLEVRKDLERKIRNKVQGTGGLEEGKDGETRGIDPVSVTSPEAKDTIQERMLDVVMDLGLLAVTQESHGPAAPAPPESKHPDGLQEPLLPPIKEELDPRDFVEVSFLPVQDPDPLSTENIIDVYSEDPSKGEGEEVEEEREEKEEGAEREVPEAHMKKRRSDPCPHCGKTFTGTFNLHRHVRTHTGERPFQCHLCSKTFSSKRNLTRHLLLHNGKRPFNCPQCKNGFKRKDHLEKHKRMHCVGKRLICGAPKDPELPSLSPQNPEVEPSGVEQGSMPFLEPEEDPLSTETFVVSASTSPASASQGKKRHPCPYCGKKFEKPWLLKHHVYTHTGERPYKCHLCPRAFTRKDHVKSHLLTHSGKKPFKCPYCPEGFRGKDGLEEHKNTHVLERLLEGLLEGEGGGICRRDTEEPRAAGDGVFIAAMDLSGLESVTEENNVSAVPPPATNPTVAEHVNTLELPSLSLDAAGFELPPLDENGVQPDPLSLDNVDIEYGVYSENLAVKREEEEQDAK